MCTVLVSLLSYCFILMRFSTGCHSYPEHDLPSRVSNLAKGYGKVRLYAQSVASDHRALSASLAEAESSSQHWESEARGSVERMARAEAERDIAPHDAWMARMDAEVAGNAQAKVEFELARVQNALAAAEEARRKADDEVSCLTDERVSLLLEHGTCKDEVFAIRAEALKENRDLEEAYEDGFDVIFNYGYGCCAFAHNICGSQPKVPDGMSNTSKSLTLEFFINPRCPLGVVSVEAASIGARFGKITNALEKEAPTAVLKDRS